MRVRAVLVGLLWIPTVAWAGDKDGDGIKNKVDKCVEQVEDTDGFEDEDGCPEVDNDDDRVEDQNDRCPMEPEDADQFEDGDGCPDPDNDGDGVLDAGDRCPTEAEDGTDGDGCLTVTLKLLSESGYMASIGTLSSSLLEAVAQEDAGCAAAASSSKAWLGANDAEALSTEWDARLSRAPEGFDTQGAKDLLGKKGEVYKPLRQALGVFCAENPAWKEVESEIDAVFARLPAAPPPPPKKKRR